MLLINLLGEGIGLLLHRGMKVLTGFLLTATRGIIHERLNPALMGRQLLKMKTIATTSSTVK